jgi:hypothetical protein
MQLGSWTHIHYQICAAHAVRTYQVHINYQQTESVAEHKQCQFKYQVMHVLHPLQIILLSQLVMCESLRMCVAHAALFSTCYYSSGPEPLDSSHTYYKGCVAALPAAVLRSILATAGSTTPKTVNSVAGTAELVTQTSCTNH